ncbi:MAG TPA: VCBS repeat-containing protein, partial [Candidatus Dormibacteraeota bacterium]|nr:VCBS repeat-containing protein [Candidatus Dormibacteraeota bacterium]
MKRFALFCWLVLISAALPTLQAQLFDNLRALGGDRYPVGHPSVVSTNLRGARVDGPKDIQVADLDNDGHPDFVASDKDGTVTVRYGIGDGTFSGPQYLRTWTTAPLDLRTLLITNYYTNIYCDFRPTNFTVNCFVNGQPVPPGSPLPLTNTVCFTNYQSGCVGTLTNYATNVWALEGPTGLRGLAIADFSGDGRPDIAVASPGESLIYVFLNRGAREFDPPNLIRSWFGARDLATGDFDGDGKPDLVAAGSTNGLVQYRSLGGGAFQVVTNLLALASDPFANRNEEDYEFPQPAYYLKAIRQPGDTRDELIVSYAQRGKIWILRANDSGRLDVTGDIENVTLTALDAGPLFHPATNGAPIDLVTSYSRNGSLDIFAATNRTQRFTGSSVQRYYVPGAPRNVRIADLDQDGWNDLVVVAQRNAKVLTYRNEQGSFVLMGEVVAGLSPREMDLGDFNGDSRPDLAVLNRGTSDVSVFMTSSNYNNGQIGFLALDSVYAVDGGVSGLELRDINRDGRADVLQLHRTTSEFSVRLTGTNGQLGQPVYYPITNATLPAAQSTADVNNDGIADLVSANLSGSVSVRLGQADGSFGPENTFRLPAGYEGSLFA